MDARTSAVGRVLDLLGASRPVLVGIAGGVGVGKSTLAEAIRDDLVARGVSIDVLCTDVFLLPNAELDQRGLSMRKGFPETYDTDALAALGPDVHAGRAIHVPVYSHATYDRVPGASRTVEPADVLLVEGVNALQPPLVDDLDLAVYLDASEDDQLAWFVERFLQFCIEARDDETSFYRGFAAMSEDEQRVIAEWTWREINGVNLRDHIAPSRSRADVVLLKERDHTLRIQGPAPRPGRPRHG